eukprot:scaffold63604_cov47-Attheya_sp.AAC.1
MVAYLYNAPGDWVPTVVDFCRFGCCESFALKKTSCNDGTGRSGGARLYTRRLDGPELLAHWPAPPLGAAAARGGTAGGFLGRAGGGGMAGCPPAPRTKAGNDTWLANMSPGKTRPCTLTCWRLLLVSQPRRSGGWFLAGEVAGLTAMAWGLLFCVALASRSRRPWFFGSFVGGGRRREEGAKGGRRDGCERVALDALEGFGHIQVKLGGQDLARAEKEFIGGVIGNHCGLGDQGMQLREQCVRDPRGTMFDLVEPGPEGSGAP